MEQRYAAQQQNYNYMKIWHPSNVVANITGGMIIGQSVTGGVPNSVLTIDGAGNLDQTTPVLANTFLSWNGAAFSWEPAVAGSIVDTQIGYGDASNQLTSDAGFTRDTATGRTTITGNNFTRFIIDGDIKAKAASALIQLGDPDSLGNNTLFLVDDSTQTITSTLSGIFKIQNLSNLSSLEIDPTSRTGIFGWVGGGANGNYLILDDSNHDSRIVTDAVGYFSVKGGANVLFQVNASANLITSGDVLSSLNQTKTVLDEAGLKFTFATGGQDRFIAFRDWTFLGELWFMEPFRHIQVLVQ